MTNMDVIGRLLLGKHYIPRPQEGEAPLDTIHRVERGEGLAKTQLNSLKSNPILSTLFSENPSKASEHIYNMTQNPRIMSSFKDSGDSASDITNSLLDNMYKQSSEQPLLSGMSEWNKKQPFNRAEEAFKKGKITRKMRDDIVSGRTAKLFGEHIKKWLKDMGK